MKRYDLVLTGKFKKSLKLAKKRGLNIDLLDAVVEKLQNGILLEEKYHDHELKGKYKGFRECHIQPDLLLMYLKEDDILVLTLVDTGHMRICLICKITRLLFESQAVTLFYNSY